MHGCGELVAKEQSSRKPNSKKCKTHRYQPELYMADMTTSDKITIFETHDLMDEHKTISIATPRKNCVFSNGKAYLFDDPNGSRRDVCYLFSFLFRWKFRMKIIWKFSLYYMNNNNQMESYNLITSQMEILPDLPLNSFFRPPISIGKYTYILGNHQQNQDDESFTNCYR